MSFVHNYIVLFEFWFKFKGCLQLNCYVLNEDSVLHVKTLFYTKSSKLWFRLQQFHSRYVSVLSNCKTLYNLGSFHQALSKTRLKQYHEYRFWNCTSTVCSQYYTSQIVCMVKAGHLNPLYTTITNMSAILSCFDQTFIDPGTHRPRVHLLRA